MNLMTSRHHRAVSDSNVHCTCSKYYFMYSVHVNVAGGDQGLVVIHVINYGEQNHLVHTSLPVPHSDGLTATNLLL